MRTPLHKKGSLRFTKTIDSVEMAKKKKSTKNKDKRKNEDSDIDNEEDRIMQNNTMPAFLHSSALKRRVTFTMDNYSIENLRSCQAEQYSPPNLRERKNSSLEKRPSILRNSGWKNEDESDI